MRLGVGSFALTFFGLGLVLTDLSPRAGAAHAEARVEAAAPAISALALASVVPPAPVVQARVVPAAASVEEETPDLFLAPAEDSGRWAPPDWFPESSRGELWALDGMERESASSAGPTVRSPSVFVYDVDSGRVLLARRADERRPVASLTKMVSGLTTLAENADLTREICIDPNSWPGWPGAHSYLNTGTCTTGWDLLGAALVASDNRAAFAFSAVAGLPFSPFVARMNEISGELGMDMSTFADPAGVDDNNLSTARDMTRAVVAASVHPVLGPVASAPFWDIGETRRVHVRRLFSTNRMAGDQELEFLAAKTGYTDTAHYCFAAVVRTASGRRVALSVLGAPNIRTRWADVRRILDWAQKG